MKIQVTFEIDEDDDYADPEHEMGLTEAGYEHLVRVIPGYDVDIKRVD
jgi:hypothetical protein